MSAHDIATALYTWTPYLAGGFVWNIVVSLAAMAIGTALGSGLAVLRLSPRRGLARTSRTLSELTRNIPTFVFLFYLAFLIPVEIPVAGHVYAFPAWLKAALALSVAVIGFVSDNVADALAQWRQGNHGTALLLIPNWTAYLIVIVMASSTASVIGVGELVSRCNTVIAAVGNTDLMLWIYLYAMLWFFIFCWPLSRLMRRIRSVMARRLALAAPGHAMPGHAMPGHALPGHAMPGRALPEDAVPEL